jgi:phosphoglycolate phosphatase-like HAD superfamily hydrolase
MQQPPLAAGRDPAPSFAVFDIDGVLADVAHRLHHVRSRRKDWRAFFAAAAGDALLAAGHARLLAAARLHAIVYVSGRPERLRPVTQSWLDIHGCPGGALLLRADRDRRPARMLKLDLVTRVAQRGEIALVVDDDAEVCRVLADAGFPVEQATWAADSTTLRRAQQRQGRT